MKMASILLTACFVLKHLVSSGREGDVTAGHLKLGGCAVRQGCCQLLGAPVWAPEWGRSH